MAMTLIESGLTRKKEGDSPFIQVTINLPPQRSESPHRDWRRLPNAKTPTRSIKGRRWVVY